MKRDRVIDIPREHAGQIVNLAPDPIPEEPSRIQRLLRPFLVSLHVCVTGRVQDLGRARSRINEALPKERNFIFQKRHQLRDFQIGIRAHRPIEIDDRPPPIVLEDVRAAEIAVAEGISRGIDPRHMREQ